MEKEAVNRRMKSWMVDAGYTQETFAEAFGVPYTTLKGWLYNGNGLSFERAEQICDFFGKSLDELACRD